MPHIEPYQVTKSQIILQDFGLWEFSPALSEKAKLIEWNLNQRH